MDAFQAIPIIDISPLRDSKVDFLKRRCSDLCFKFGLQDSRFHAVELSTN